MNEDFAWVLKCIDTSFTDFHFQACQLLIDLFAKKHAAFLNEEKQLQKALDLKISLAQ